MKLAHRAIGLVGGGLLALSLAAVTAPGAAAADATAAPRHHGDCSVRLDERGDRLIVRIDGADDGRARVRANFNRGRHDSDSVRLNGRGNGTVRFDIPDRARFVRVDVEVRDRDSRDTARCDDRLRLDRRR